MSPENAYEAAAFHSQVMSCEDVAAVGATLTHAIASLNFTACAAGAFIPSREGAKTIFYFQDWPTEWLERYDRENFVNHDFTVAEARASMVPFYWSEAKARRTLTLREQGVLDAAADYGWFDGFCVPFHGPGGYFGLLVMAGSDLDYSTARRQHLFLLAASAHERCLQLVPLPAPASIMANLTSRELECMRWVAAGQSDEQIASHLRLSGKTVKDYVDNARGKISARTRAQAVAILVSGGLI